MCKTFSGKLVGSKYPRTINHMTIGEFDGPMGVIGSHHPSVLVVYWWCADVIHRNDRGECCFVLDGKGHYAHLRPQCRRKFVCACVAGKTTHMRRWEHEIMIITSFLPQLSVVNLDHLLLWRHRWSLFPIVSEISVNSISHSWFYFPNSWFRCVFQLAIIKKTI